MAHTHTHTRRNGIHTLIETASTQTAMIRNNQVPIRTFPLISPISCLIVLCFLLRANRGQVLFNLFIFNILSIHILIGLANPGPLAHVGP